MDKTTEITNALYSINRDFRIVKYNMAREAGLNTSEYEFLISLLHSEKTLSIKELSNELLLCSQAITKISKHLEKLGLIESEKSTKDRRITYINLSKEGKDLANREARYRNKLISQFTEDLSDKELETVSKAMNSIAGGVSQKVDEALNARPVPSVWD
jgi:MarR family 2-MHQ and catechol resistance regulon transcriptional repressor